MPLWIATRVTLAHGLADPWWWSHPPSSPGKEGRAIAARRFSHTVLAETIEKLLGKVAGVPRRQ